MTPEEMRRREQEEQAYFRQMANRMKAQFAQMPYFPAQLVQTEVSQSVQITAEVSAFYAKVFQRYELYGNGYCWESIIQQLIAQRRPDWMAKLDFDAEAEVCLILGQDETTVMQLAEFLHDNLATTAQFEAVLRSIDTDRLDC